MSTRPNWNQRERRKKPDGAMRQSQLINTFGPGAMTDLPDRSVLISGLDFWVGDREQIHEPRLSAKVADLLGKQSVRLETPPSSGDLDDQSNSGIAAFRFPEWFVTQHADTLEATSSAISGSTRYLVHRRSLARGSKFIEPERGTKLNVVPIRFVRACRRGHIGDIDWYFFVHGDDNTCRSKGSQLYLDQQGTSGDLSEIVIRCACKKTRRMSQIAAQKAEGLGRCDGARPWLGPRMAEQGCNEPNRLLVRTASNAYFPQRMSVISLPDLDAKVREAVTAAWLWLSEVQSEEDVAYERRKTKVEAALTGLSNDRVWAEVLARRSGNFGQQKSVKVAELETLLANVDDLGEDRVDGLFFARNLDKSEWNQPWMSGIAKVVLVHRLREVMALVGFTRFEAAGPDPEGELDIDVRRADLGRNMTWVPAVENRGEGIFLEFRKESIDEWASRPGVSARVLKLRQGFNAWKDEHSGSTRDFPTPSYVLLHTLAHLLLTEISLECGYPTSSIRERIYALPKTGYGILLYTGSSDAEGTLGGLVQVGHRISDLVRSALEHGALCSNDPVCAQHDPRSLHERRFLLGAACHGCLLIAETSCEQQNELLDRALVIPTVDDKEAAFFS